MGTVERASLSPSAAGQPHGDRLNATTLDEAGNPYPKTWYQGHSVNSVADGSGRIVDMDQGLLWDNKQQLVNGMFTGPRGNHPGTLVSFSPG